MVTTLEYGLIAAFISAIAVLAIVIYVKKFKNAKIQLPTLPTISENLASKIISAPVDNDTGKTKTVKKFTLSIDILMLASVFAGFLAFMFAYLSPDNAIFSVIIGSVLYLPIGALIGAMLSGSMRIKLMRRLTGRNYGYVKFIYSNRLIKPIIVNLDNDIIRSLEGIYLINKSRIKREGNEAVSSDRISDNNIKFEEGIPTIYYDVQDMIPVDFSNSPANLDDKFRLPTQVSATLNKEISVEKAKIMKAFKSQQNLMMVIIIGMLLVIMYFTYTTYNGEQTSAATINNLNSAVQTLRDTIAARLI